MSDEVWRPVVGWPGYEVSSLGQVRSWRVPGQRHGKATSPRLLLQRNGRNGYPLVRLNWDGGGKHVRVHVLVARAFLGERPVNTETRHLDGNRENNHISNLRYGSRAENRNDRIAHGRDHNLTKTRCPAGHAYDDANTYVSRKGYRVCRACHAATQRRYLARRQAC